MSTEAGGDRIGPYQILSELGQGGMGTVYKALQPSVNRIIALKVLPANYNNDEVAIKRFAQEAETSANLDHVNIVKVWEASVSQPPYYIAMQFLDGGTLADRLTSGPLSVNEAIRLIRGICSGLDHAHSKGIVHRDIKPANIMFGANDTPVITDFGIARAVERTRLTAVGAAFGTPDYMSPEQANGKSLDHRSDLYSAAIVFYEMITGRAPFKNENPLVTLNQIVNETIPMPSELGIQVPPSVEGVLYKALAKSADERYQSGMEFVNALTEAIQNPKNTAYKKGTKARNATNPPIKKQNTGGTRVVDTGSIKKHVNSSKAVLWGILSAVVACLVGLGLYAFMNSSQEGGSGGASMNAKVTVPSVIGVSISDARKSIETAGLVVGDVEERKDSKTARGCVISCEPGVGEKVDQRTPVAFVVSDGVPSFNCSVCSKSFGIAEELNSHLKSHNVKVYVCNQCASEFNTTIDLKSHIKNTHKLVSSPTEEIFTCTKCGAEFNSKRRLSAHIKGHETPVFACPKCNESFSTGSALDNHMNTHADPAKQYEACSVSGQRPGRFCTGTKMVSARPGSICTTCQPELPAVDVCSKTGLRPGRYCETVSRHVKKPAAVCGSCGP